MSCLRIRLMSAVTILPWWLDPLWTASLPRASGRKLTDGCGRAGRKLVGDYRVRNSRSAVLLLALLDRGLLLRRVVAELLLGLLDALLEQLLLVGRRRLNGRLLRAVVRIYANPGLGDPSGSGS